MAGKYLLLRRICLKVRESALEAGAAREPFDSQKKRLWTERATNRAALAAGLLSPL